MREQQRGAVRDWLQPPIPSLRGEIGNTAGYEEEGRGEGSG